MRHVRVRADRGTRGRGRGKGRLGRGPEVRQRGKSKERQDSRQDDLGLEDRDQRQCAYRPRNDIEGVIS
jgi:hypothetical protein